MNMLACQKDLFDLEEAYTYLNCAYMSPQLKSVSAAGKLALLQKARPYNISPTDFFTTVEQVKSVFAQIINCKEQARIAIMPSASYGIATAAANINIEQGQEILVLKDQFPSNYYAWQKLAESRSAQVKVIEVAAGDDKGKRWNEAILSAINEKTAVVAIAHVHWAEGVLFDLAAIREKTTAVGAYLVIDGTQSVGALPFDVQSYQPDVLVCAAYKWLMGPYGLALAYMGPSMDAGRPIEENWINRKNSEDFSGLVNYQDDYQALAGRYSVGEQSNFVLMPMLLTALQQIYHWQPKRIQAYCEHLSRPYLNALTERGFKVLPQGQRASHLICVQLPDDLDVAALKERLLAHKVFVSFRGNAMRIAPHLYNDQRDWERLIKCIL